MNAPSTTSYLRWKQLEDGRTLSEHNSSRSPKGKQTRHTLLLVLTKCTAGTDDDERRTSTRIHTAETERTNPLHYLYNHSPKSPKPKPSPPTLHPPNIPIQTQHPNRQRGGQGTTRSRRGVEKPMTRTGTSPPAPTTTSADRNYADSGLLTTIAPRRVPHLDLLRK